MIKSALSLVALALCVAPALAEPGTTTEAPNVPQVPGAVNQTPSPSAAVTAKVNIILDTHHLIPTRADWVRVAGDAAGLRELIRVAKDNKELLIRRQRALTGLSYFPTPDAIAATESLVTNTTLSHRVRGSAARAFATQKGKAAVSTLAGLLNDPNHRLRESLIKALGSIQDTTAMSALRAHLASESKTYLKAEIRKLVENAGQTTKAQKGDQP